MFKRYFIETVRSGRTNGGMGCGGWHPGPVIAEIKVKTEDGEHFYLSVVQLSDGVCYYKTEESTFDKQIEEIDDQDFWDSLNDRIIIFGESFDELLLDSFGDPFIFLYKYLSVIVKEPKECEIVHVNQYVDFCQNCRKFFISEIEFSSKFGKETGSLLRCFRSSDGQIFGPKYGTGMGILNEESPLKKSGYSVSKQDGLSSNERQMILDNVILYGVMDVSAVKAYLEFYIDYLGKNPNMEDAVGSWIMDLNYIKSSYSRPLGVFFDV